MRTYSAEAALHDKKTAPLIASTAQTMALDGMDSSHSMNRRHGPRGFGGGGVYGFRERDEETV